MLLRVEFNGTPNQFGIMVGMYNAVLHEERGAGLFVLLPNNDKDLVVVRFLGTKKGNGYGDIHAQSLPGGRSLLFIYAKDAFWPGVEPSWELLYAEMVRQEWIDTGKKEASRSVHVPPVEDPTDRRILEWVTEDPDLTDQQIGQRLGITRQAANTRRKRLEGMGYKVR